MDSDRPQSSFAFKYERLPQTIHDFAGPYLDFANSDILEFGCGDAAALLGTHHRFHPRKLVGTELVPDFVAGLEEARQLGLEVPDDLDLRLVKPDELVRPGEKFDFIYNWSVMEHVSQPLLPSVLAGFHEILKPGGFLFIQIGPLYYSAYGHHLRGFIPEPWVHLTTQHNLLKDRVMKLEPTGRIWGVYSTLNRLCAPELLALVSEAGFELLREYYSQDKEDIPRSIQAVYNPETIKTQQVIGLWRKK